MIEILQSKIHRATVTKADKEYEGSISIDRSLARRAGIVEYQKVLVADIDNSARFETYVIYSKVPGEICVNGAAAGLVDVGDRVIILAFCITEREDAERGSPIIIRVDDNNRVREE